MQSDRFIDLLALWLHDEVTSQSSQELLFRQTIQIFHDPVIVDDRQLIGREADRHEVVVLLIPLMIRVLLGLLRTDQRSGGRTVMAIGDIERRHSRKQFGDAGDVLCVINDPEGVSEAIQLGYEVILRFTSRVFGHDLIQLGVIRIGKEDRLDVGIVHTHMFHAILLLVAPCQLMLLDHAIHVVGHISADHQSILGLAIHGLRIDVIALLLVLHQPALLLEQLEVLRRLQIDRGIMLVSTHRKVNLRLYDMIKGLLIARSLCPCLLRVQHVIRPGSHLLDQCLRRPNALEWFNYCHNSNVIY